MNENGSYNSTFCNSYNDYYFNEYDDSDSNYFHDDNFDMNDEFEELKPDKQIFIPGNSIRIIFRSDSLINHQGFELSVTSGITDQTHNSGTHNSGHFGERGKISEMHNSGDLGNPAGLLTSRESVI